MTSRRTMNHLSKASVTVEDFSGCVLCGRDRWDKVTDNWCVCFIGQMLLPQRKKHTNLEVIVEI